MDDRPETSAATPRSRKGLTVGIVVAVVVVLAVGGGLLWFFRDDAPPPVDLGTATESVDGDDATTGSTSSGAGATEDVSGTWTVDTESGTFDFEDATGSFVGFRVEEELTIGSATAVGRTPEVTGELLIEGDTLTSAEITANLDALTTNDSRRDNRAKGALDTEQFPNATFVLTEALSFGDAASSGEQVSVDAVGELTIHGVTREVTIPLQAQLVDGTIVVVGSTDITFADYDVEPPSAPIVLSVAPEGILELQLLLTQQ